MLKAYARMAPTTAPAPTWHAAPTPLVMGSAAAAGRGAETDIAKTAASASSSREPPSHDASRIAVQPPALNSSSPGATIGGWAWPAMSC